MEIPRYPASRPLEGEDKPLFDELFRQMQPRISELTFAGLFLFRKAHDYTITLAGDSHTLMGRGYDGAPYFLPPLDGSVPNSLALLFDSGQTLYGADDDFAGRYLQGSGIVITEDRDNFDYLYQRAELAELPGNRYHKKKNRLNYFTSRHSFTVELFTESLLPGCLRILDEWTRVRAGDDSSSLGPETEADREALEMASFLGLQGVVVLVDGEVKGFALGERLNNDTSVCHFEKADPFMEGLYQLLDREFNRLLFTDCAWVNREQDLGEPNLRQTKLSYHPVELVRKFRARRVES